MTRCDKWKKRPVIERWLAYKDLVALSYRQAGGKTYMEPVQIFYEFFLADNRRIDSDNLVKGINDALLGLAFPDDCVFYIRRGTFGVNFIPKGNQEHADITIEPLGYVDRK
jgi:Holliday junction resolvase RusA-like endonuclease